MSDDNDDDDVMAQMAAETKRIKAAEAERTKAIEAAEQAADSVIAAYADRDSDDDTK